MQPRPAPVLFTEDFLEGYYTTTSSELRNLHDAARQLSHTIHTNNTSTMPLNREITIPSTSTSTTSPPYTIYHLKIATPSALRATSLPKRYSDFTALHSLLTTQTGSPPPAPLPAKSWFTRTVNNAALTESRRLALQAYIAAIEASPDTKWRNSPAWVNFLNLPDAPTPRGGSLSTGGLRQEDIRTPGAWLDAFASLKARLQEARLCLSKREQAATTAGQHEAGAQAKKSLVLAGGLVTALEEGLARLSGKMGSEEGGERLGEGEVRRRRDMISGARKEREGLEGVLNSMAAKVASPVESTGGQAAALRDDKEGLFGGGKMMSGVRQGRQLGVAKETERTRELDNQQVLQLQKKIMEEQDLDVEDLTKAIRRMGQMGTAINDELQYQEALLQALDADVDRQDGKIKAAKRKLATIR